MKYEAIIVEDKQNLCEALELLLQTNCPGIEVCGSAGSVQDASMYLKSNTVDFLFIDISMPGEDVLAFLESMPESQMGIIFISECQEHLLQVLKANSIDYLMKPLDAVALIHTMKKAIMYYELRKSKMEISNAYQESLANFRHHIKTEDKTIKKITIPDEYGFKVVNVTDLIFLQSDSNYTILHITGSKIIVANWPLEEFEKILGNNAFFAINKSTIINLDYLKTNNAPNDETLELTDGTKLTISRKKMNAFLNLLIHSSKAINLTGLSTH